MSRRPLQPTKPPETWDFASGRGLPDAQALTSWDGAYAASVLAAALAGDVTLGPAFWRRAAAVRDGERASTAAGAYVRPQATNSEPIARLLDVAAGTLDPAAAADALGHERACGCNGCAALEDGFLALQRAVAGTPTIRALDDDDRAVPLDGDRRRALRADWRLKLREGARLLALRGAGRCLGCEHTRRRTAKGDYCERCDRGTDWRHVDARNAVLASAARALSGHARDTLRSQ